MNSEKQMNTPKAVKGRQLLVKIFFFLHQSGHSDKKK